MADIKAIHEPPETVETAGGEDIKSVSGASLYGQRILRLLFLRPGDLKHRPTLGAGLQDFANKIPTPETMRQVRFRVETLLDALPYIEGYSFKVARGENHLMSLVDMRVNTSAGELVLPEVQIGDS